MTNKTETKPKDEPKDDGKLTLTERVERLEAAMLLGDPHAAAQAMTAK